MSTSEEVELQVRRVGVGEEINLDSQNEVSAPLRRRVVARPDSKDEVNASLSKRELSNTPKEMSILQSRVETANPDAITSSVQLLLGK